MQLARGTDSLSLSYSLGVYTYIYTKRNHLFLAPFIPNGGGLSDYVLMFTVHPRARDENFGVEKVIYIIISERLRYRGGAASLRGNRRLNKSLITRNSVL